MHKFIPGIIWLILQIVSWFPGFILRFLSHLAHFTTFTALQYRLDVVNDNLGRSFPELSQQKRDEIAGRFTRHFSELFLEMALFVRLKPKTCSKRIRLANPEMLVDACQQKKNIIILSGHYGNWEWNLLPILASGYRVLAVYKPQTSLLADKLMFQIRHKPGITLVPMKDTLRVIKRELSENGTPFALLLVADQIPARGDIRFWTRFLGQDTAFFTGGEKLARKFRLPVFYIDQVKSTFARYVSTTTLVYDGVESTEEGAITKTFAGMLEATVRRQPHLWLWSHRRWKYRREELPLHA